MINLRKTIYKRYGFKESELKFSSALYYLHDLDRANHLTSLSLPFLTWKMIKIVLFTSQIYVWY